MEGNFSRRKAENYALGELPLSLLRALLSSLLLIPIMKATAALYARVRRVPLTTKQVSNGFYKGTGTGAMGRHTKHGGYLIQWHKVRTYVVPDQLQNCNVCILF